MQICYQYTITLDRTGLSTGKMITSNNLVVCRPNGGLVSLSINTQTGAIFENFDLSQSSLVTFDPTIPQAGLAGLFHGKYSQLSFYPLGTYRRLFIARNSPFGMFGKTILGNYITTGQPLTGYSVPIDPTLPKFGPAM
jgi:hypothetical protein